MRMILNKALLGLTIIVTSALVTASCVPCQAATDPCVGVTCALDWSAYEAEGYVSGDRNPGSPSGNSLLFTAEKFIALTIERGAPSLEDAEEFSRLVARAQLSPGLYARTPAGYAYHEDQEGHDDYIGIAAASAVLGTPHALAIVQQGENPFKLWGPIDINHYYPNKPGALDWRAWFGRFPATVAHFEYAAGVTPNLWHRLMWAYSVATAGADEPTAQDPWILSWLMVKTTEGHEGWMARQAVAIWRTRLKRHWPGGIGQVLARYFNNPQHPLALALQGEGT